MIIVEFLEIGYGGGSTIKNLLSFWISTWNYGIDISKEFIKLQNELIQMLYKNGDVHL